jgi:Ser/Thr protein kinase RdoA (MazF antagonist)
VIEFDQLTRSGRARRLRPLVRAALAQYGVDDDASVSLLAMHSFNTMFEVRPQRGGRLVLRVGDLRRIHADGVEELEAEWIDALLRDAGIEGPMFERALDGSASVDASASGVPGRRRCSLASWVPGRQLRERLDERGAADAGRLLAAIHDQAAGFVPAAPMPPAVRADRVVYFEPSSLLAEHESEHGSLFRDAIARVSAVIDGLWADPPHAPHLLHGDFGAANVLRARGRLRPIDFQDLQFGFAVQDVAITVSDLRRTRPGLRGAFEAGYRSVRPWPVDDERTIETLGMGRILNVMNLGLVLRRGGFAEFFSRHTATVDSWMRSDP